MRILLLALAFQLAVPFAFSLSAEDIHIPDQLSIHERHPSALTIFMIKESEESETREGEQESALVELIDFTKHGCHLCNYHACPRTANSSQGHLKTRLSLFSLYRVYLI